MIEANPHSKLRNCETVVRLAIALTYFNATTRTLHACARMPLSLPREEFIWHLDETIHLDWLNYEG